MKLLLVNKCDVKFHYDESANKGMRWWVTQFKDITPSDLINKRDNEFFMAKAVVWAKIIKSQALSTLSVYVVLNDSGDRKILQVGDPKDERCILKQLLGIFENKFNISVCIKISTEPDEMGKNVFIFKEGMGIRKGICCGEVIRANEFEMRETSFDIIITANISEDHELILAAMEEIPLSLRTSRKILYEGLGSDVVIIAGNGKGIKSHRSFLTASSPVIERMFGSEMEECKTGQVDMTDLSEEGVRAFLRYIYCRDKIAPEADLNLAFELLYASHKYEVSKLEELMILYWTDIKDLKIGVGLAFKVYMFLRSIVNAYKLKTKMVRILHRRYIELEHLPEYEELYKNPCDAMELCKDLVMISKVEE